MALLSVSRVHNGPEVADTLTSTGEADIPPQHTAHTHKHTLLQSGGGAGAESAQGREGELTGFVLYFSPRGEWQRGEGLQPEL